MLYTVRITKKKSYDFILVKNCEAMHDCTCGVGDYCGINIVPKNILW